MFWFIAGIIVTIVLFFALGVNWKEETFGLKFRQVFCLAGMLLALIGCMKSVPTGHTGIVTTFGKVENYTLDAGISFEAPWKKVIKMDNRTQKQSVTLSCFSSDIQEVTAIYTVNYQIDKANAQEIYRNIGQSYYDIIVYPTITESVKAVMAKYNAEELISSRTTLASEIEVLLKEKLTPYNIQIVSTSMEDIDFNDTFTNAVEAKQVAQQNKLKAQTEQEQMLIEAEAAAQKAVIEAQAKADAAIIAANNDAEIVKIQADSAEYQGQKDAAIMAAIGEQLSQHPELIEYYIINGWNGDLPDTMLSDNMNTLFQIR